jgi:DNA replication protein DnaC
METETTDTTADDPQAKLIRIEKLISSRVSRYSQLDNRLEQRQREWECSQLEDKLGVRYCDATLGSFQVYDDRQQAVVDQLKQLTPILREQLKVGGLIFLGPPGTGKDHLMAAMLRLAVMGHGLTVDWWDGAALFSSARQAISEDGERDLIQRLTRPQVLGLSDPQPPKGDLTSFQTSLLRHAIDVRYRRGLSTWMSTNLDNRADAAEVLTEPLLQRIREGAVKIVCDWPSYRDRVKPIA